MSLLHELVAEQAGRSPLATAIAWEHGTLAYAELDRRANHLARELIARGAGPESLVGVRMRRGPELVVALLGVWKAGAAYVPLDPEHPADRLRWVLEDTGAELVVTEADLVADLSEVTPILVTHEQADAVANTARGGNAAYAIYTSGSTGRPKGVVVPHDAIANRVLWAVERHGLSEKDSVLQKTALTFDAACWEFFGPLISGGTVVLAPAGAERDPAMMVESVIRHGVTVLQGVPSVFRLLAEEPAWRDCVSLRLLFSAGEPLHAELGRKLTEGLKAELWNTYGPTECAIDVTAGAFDPVQEAGPVPIGKPITNVRILVLDADGEPVPIGVPGELHAGGRNVGRGYLGRPDLTAEKFVPDPYGAPGARLYRTGDQVRWRPDGTLEYLGRIDQQVKINGVRIEPGEIEAALVAHPEVSAAVVVPFEVNGVKRLAAYIVDSVPAGLREFLADRLPEALIPSAFVALDAFPLTTSGKVDRAALPAPEIEQERVLPRTPAERLVAGIWAELLGVAEVGVHDDFFALGGSSLVLTRLGRRLREASGGEVQLRSLFTATTVERQAALLAAATETAPAIVPVPRDGELPLSFTQERLWFLDRMDPGSKEWVTPVLLKLDAALDPGTVRRGLEALAARHESLRTRYPVRDGAAAQVIEATPQVDLRVTDTAPDGLGEVFAAQLERGFDLAGGPVWRALLARVPGEQQHLLITIHHIASDGWSTAVLERELRALWAGEDLAPMPVQFADFAAWERGWLTEERLAAGLTYWRDTLAGFRPLELSADRPRPAERDPSGATAAVVIPAELAARLGELGRQHGTTPFMTLLAGYAALLARYTGQWDTVVGAPVAGRDRPETHGLIGCLLNTLALRTDLQGLTFTGALAKVREVCTGAFAHADVPFERLVEAVQPERDMSRTPIYQVAFDLLDAGATSTAASEAESAAFQQAWRVAKTDLTLFLWRAEDGSLTGAFEYATSLFDAGTIEALSAHFTQFLAAVAAQPDALLATVDYLADEEKALLRPEIADLGPGVSLPQLFEEQVAESPEAPAVVFDEDILSYAELNEQANRLAHLLRARGAAPEQLVGVCLERGPDLVPALLGILKSGAGYLPIEPGLPDDRIAFMLSDAQARLLVTDEAMATRLGTLFEGELIVLGAEEGQSTANPVPVTLPGHLAYAVYTSGSTGRPKGVVATHGNVSRFMAAADARYGFTAEDVWTMFHSFAFDVSVWEMFGALLYGGTLVVVPRAATQSPEDLLELLYDHQVTILHQTPSGFRGVTGLARDGHPKAAHLALRKVILAGEKPELTELAQWASQRGLDRPELFNMYGITETTVESTTHRLTEADLAPGRNPVGYPFTGVSVVLLDAEGQLVPHGVPGEVYLGGHGVARGYLNRPDLTAERFVPGPDGTRLYRSGDLAKRNADGSLEFLGRIDEQVKFRGYRIELGEVTAVLAEHPAVREAVVVIRDEALVAYYVAAEPIPVAELADLCTRHLAEYMVPSAFVALDRMPLAATGKLDRKALPAPGRSAQLAGEFVAPRNVVEERVAEIWQELLGTAPGVFDNFFRVGGHSLLAVRLSSALGEEFDLEVSVRDVFDHATVAAQAALVEDRIRAEYAEEEAAPEPESLASAAIPVEIVRSSASGALARASVPATDPVFAGHYPGFPLLPGVYVLELAHRAAVAAGHGTTLAEIVSCRFLGPVSPGDELLIDVSLVDGQHSVSVTASDKPVAEMLLRYEKENPA
ncbi:non-ribosomal peptide synthetase [Longispora albida]|uniref:non-ribosomal peptide synthetase n=1 Tax=Longispora albida TaxID=203523 RepID=UPI00037E03D4|nr:non-ribosomal peptide synthetase [Longispora albida]